MTLELAVAKNSSDLRAHHLTFGRHCLNTLFHA